MPDVPPVQALPSSHGVPGGELGYEQTQFSSMKSSVQSLPSSQNGTTQFPLPSQAPSGVQANPSSQGVPAGTGGKTQRPVAGSQPFDVQSIEVVALTADGAVIVDTPRVRVAAIRRARVVVVAVRRRSVTHVAAVARVPFTKH